MSDPPRILMLIAFLHHVGGAQRQAKLLAGALREMGVPVAFLTGRPRGAANQEVVEGVPVRRVSFLDGVKLGRVKFHVLIRGMVRQMLARADEYDIIHVHQGLWPAYAGTVAARELGKPCLIKVGNTGKRFDFCVLARSPFFGKRMARHCLRHASRVVAPSRAAQRQLMEFGFPPERIVFLPNGVRVPPVGPVPDPEARRALGVKGDERLVLFVGSLTPHKRPLLALEAFRLAAKAAPEARLWLLGEGPLRRALTRRIREMGLTGRVRCCGEVPDVERYLRAADAFVLPSAAEGMSNALLEAMAHALPCIATRISGSEDLIVEGENGLLVPPDEPASLGEALRQVLADPARSRRLGDAARRTVQEGYSIESVARRYLDVYRAL